jgi:hypothetical protein
MAGRERHGEEGGDEETATIDGGAEGIAQEKMQRASGDVRRRAEQRPALPGERRQGVDRAQCGDAQRDGERRRSQSPEEDETHGQQASRQRGHFSRADTSGREDAGGLLGVAEIR